MKKDFIMMVGLPASGKSTITEQLKAKYEAQGEACTVVSSDAIREELYGSADEQTDPGKVFNIAKDKVIQALKCGEHVILDATNIASKKRRHFLEEISPYLKLQHRAIAKVVLSESVKCEERDIARAHHHAGKAAINKMLHSFEIPYKEEGFDKIEFVTPEYILPMSRHALITLMNDFNQCNPHHNKTIGGHAAETSVMFQKKGYKESWHKFAAAFHDVGKLYTQRFDEDGIAHYYNHENVGAYYMACYGADIKKKTGLSDEEWLDALFLINYHMRPHRWLTEKSLKRAEKAFGKEKMQLLLDFNECDKFRDYDLSLQTDNEPERCLD